MLNDKSNIIIIEGPQGVGKSTLANFLRDNISMVNLYCLSGIKDKSVTGKNINKNMYLTLINYLETLEETGINLVFDRIFFSEQVYCMLGYKDYKFDDIYERLLQKLNILNFNIYLVILYFKDEKNFKYNLNRKHHNYHTFSLKSSIDQQNAYLALADNIKLDNIKIIKIAMDDYKEGYKKIIESIPLLREEIKDWQDIL